MNSWSVISFLNELELICLHTSIGVASVLLLTLIILFIINHLFSDSEMVTSIAI